MKQKTITYPALTKKDILVLKGSPAAKMMKGYESFTSSQLEEWVYYNQVNNSKEHYLFKDEHLVNWEKE